MIDYYLLALLAALLVFLFFVRRHFYKKHLVKRLNRKTLKIIENAHLMNKAELAEAHAFLYDKEKARKIKLNFWDSATTLISIREEILRRIEQD